MESVPNFSPPLLPPSSSLGIGASNSSCQILPPLSIRPGNYDRAWNDPPVFGVEINGMGKPVPTKLNKRVAYPGLSSVTSESGAGTAPGSTPLLPPNLGPSTAAIVPENTTNPMSHPLPAIPPTKVDFIPSFPSPGSTPEEDTEISTSNVPINVHDKGVDSHCKHGMENIAESKGRVMTLLQEALSQGNQLEPHIEVEVKKRLEILDSKWETLSKEVQQKLIDLGNRIEGKDYKGAESIQLSLSFDFMSQCGPWIMALKQIIRKHQE